ncbi:hypothetical protein K9M79_05030 [Candidatus Woesearchaeota archaeon]|nr:hypothetical protein [Candidatus Woesearchaeota archaeon]
MKKTKGFCFRYALILGLFISILLLNGCYTIGSGPMIPPVKHHYELKILNMDNEPIEGATVTYTIMEEGYSFYEEREPNIISNSLVTDSDGIIRDSIWVIGWRWNNQFKESNFSCTVSKTGYYNRGTWMDSDYGSRWDSLAVVKETVVLIRPIDYLERDFALELSENSLQSEILSLIDLIKLEGLIANTSLSLNSIKLNPFKENVYLQIKFSNNDRYNSIQLNKYEIGKIMFDEVVRKILNPLNDYISESESFFGYDLTVIGHTKNFLQTLEPSQPIEYRFLIPKTVVKDYKNQDLTGQQLLDNSIILMDNERIDLKLQ